MKTIDRVALAATLAAVIPAPDASAQALASRIAAAPPGHVQFSFPARPGVCGNGRTFIQTGPNSFTGSFTVSPAETLRTEPCEPGPVRVLLDRADREIIEVRTYVGPPDGLPANTDLGAVQPQEAVNYLLDLAVRGVGRVGRDAIFPATLAADADPTDGLIAIGANGALARETRTTALSHLGRSTQGLAAVPARVTQALVAVARDEADNLAVRKQALTVLGRLEHGAGIPPLTELARRREGGFLAREATAVLAGSGDPRARTFLRAAVQNSELSEEALAVAIRGLGERYATREDAELLRAVYPRLDADRTRDAVLAAVAGVGGTENVRWLLDLARNTNEPAARRRRALEQASRAGAPMAELVRLYDTVEEHQLKEGLVATFARSGDRSAVDKLIWIAQNETNINVRRRAVSALSNSDDPRAKEALKAIITR